MERQAPIVAGLSIGETASRVGVSASTLRSWDRRYGLGPSGRSGGGFRASTPPVSSVGQPPRLRRFEQIDDDRLINRLLLAAAALARRASLALPRRCSTNAGQSALGPVS